MTKRPASAIRFGSFVWNNSVNIVDSDSSGRYSTTFRAPNLDTPEEGDSITVTQYRKGGFATSVDWSTSVSLPILLRSTWKLVPSVGITNASASGPFAVRNAFTGGGYVHQGKRLNFSASLAPTFFGFLPGIGPISRFRHSISPTISYSYSPASTVSEAFAQALRGAHRIRSPEKWVWRVAFRIAAGELKERRRYVRPEDASYELDERAQAVVSALGRLSPRQRMAVVLHYYAGFTTSEIGAMTGSAGATVAVHLHRARKKLKEMLEEKDE